MLRTFVFLSRLPCRRGLPGPRSVGQAAAAAVPAETVRSGVAGAGGPIARASGALGGRRREARHGRRRAVDAKSHFDVEVVCEGPFKRPPQSCFLDGMQLGSGATLGKRTIEVVEAKQLVVKIRNPRTKKAVEVRPTRKLLDILEPPAQTEGGKHDEGHFEQIARRIAAMPEAEYYCRSPPIVSRASAAPSTLQRK